jgi:tripartite-type tricarboxylate transporter receptor subunit TctC
VARKLKIALFLATLLCLSGPASAQSYPHRPVSIIIPVGAGVGADVIMRILADRLSQRWGQQVVIVNKPGASGAIAAQAAALAAPDGYTLNMAVSSNFVVAPETGTKWTVDLATDFVTIGLISDQPMIIAVSPSLGVNSLPEFIAHAKSKPNEILYGGTRMSVPHLTGELLNQRAGIKMRFIPTTGGAAKVIQDIMNGNLQAVTDSVPGIRNAIRSGAVKALAFTGNKRLESFPDLPLASETLPGFYVRGWFALLAPVKTPPEIVSQIRADLRETLEDDGLRKRYEAIGTFPLPSTLEEAQAFIKQEQDLWRPLVRQLGGH